MIKKFSIFGGLVVLTAFFVVIVCFAMRQKYNVDESNTTWNEIQIDNEIKNVAYACRSKFDKEKIIEEADYVFCGNIIGRKEYEVEWTDEDGEKWGPFSNSVIEVKINKEYAGVSPVDDDVIRVYYPYSLSTAFDNSFMIEDNGEYVFVTRAFDEEFIKKRNENNPEDKYEQEKYADVYISNSTDYIMPVENETVYANAAYFSDNNEIIKKSSSSAECKNAFSMSDADIRWYAALERNNFDSAFSKLFDDSKKLNLK